MRDRAVAVSIKSLDRYYRAELLRRLGRRGNPLAHDPTNQLTSSTQPSISTVRPVRAESRAASSTSIIAIPCSVVTGGSLPSRMASATPR